MPAVQHVWLQALQCYAELAVSSPAVAVTTPVLILPTHGGMARLSWPEWLGQCTPVSVLTWLGIVTSVQFIWIVYVRPIVIASSYHQRSSSRHRPCRIVQFSDGDRSRMMMTSHCERLLEVSSRLWDLTQRSCVIHIMTVDSAGFSSHGVSTTVDTMVVNVTTGLRRWASVVIVLVYAG